MVPTDEALDSSNYTPVDDDVIQNASENDSSDLVINFINDFGYDPFDDDDLE